MARKTISDAFGGKPTTLEEQRAIWAEALHPDAIWEGPTFERPIQTIGRAARHIHGTAILYADTITQSMERAIAETARRRDKQLHFNAEHGIVPRGVSKRIKDIIDGVYDVDAVREERKAAEQQAVYAAMDERTVAREIKRLEKQMLDCAKNLEFEKAAELRDRMLLLEKQELMVREVMPGA